MTYQDQLKDPRWQRVQSEIRERDKYKCRICGDTTTFLHIHHIYYQPKLKAWEYDKESLVTLCENCHQFAHAALPKIIALMTFWMLKEGVSLLDIEIELRKRLHLNKNNDIIPF